MNKVIETQESCNICGKKFLMPHICMDCRENRNLLTENRLLKINSNIKLISVIDIKDDDVIVIECLEMNDKIHNSIEELSRKILQVTEKKVTFILMEKGMKLKHIPEAQLKSIGLKRIKKDDKKVVDIW